MESPESIDFAGNGMFVLGDSIVEAPFTLFKYPYWIGFEATGEDLRKRASELFSDDISVKISGTLNDGRSVKADELHITEVSHWGTSPTVQLTAFEGVCLGQDRGIPPNESRYPLINYPDGSISFCYDGWEINTISSPNHKANSNLLKKWRIPTEGMVLQLKCDGAGKEQHLNFMQIVVSLLSLASGTGVSSRRQYFLWNNEEIEIWRERTGDEIGPGRIVPEFETTNFLKQALPVWYTLSPKQQNSLRLAIHYINLSARGYLDTRLLYIMQPWEFLADAWATKGKLSEPVECLRSRLQQTRKQWNKDHNNCDPEGFWGSRISSIFDWTKLRDAIEQLAAEFDLALAMVGLDLNQLKKARDSVAHSGELPEANLGTHRRNIDILIASQHCLQLLLLRIFGYQGQVYHSTDGFRTIVNMDKALNTIRT